MPPARKTFTRICLAVMALAGVGDMILALTSHPHSHYRLALGVLLIAGAVQAIRRNSLLRR